MTVVRERLAGAGLTQAQLTDRIRGGALAAAADYLELTDDVWFSLMPGMTHVTDTFVRFPTDTFVRSNTGKDKPCPFRPTTVGIDGWNWGLAEFTRPEGGGVVRIQSAVWRAGAELAEAGQGSRPGEAEAV